MIETIERNGEIFAIIIKSSFTQEGAHFFTPANFSLQLGYNNYKAGHKIDGHYHPFKPIEIHSYQEIILIRSGKVIVTLYDDAMNFFARRELTTGDVIHLAKGGHGFEIIEDAEMILIKQGPVKTGEGKVMITTTEKL